MTPAQTGRTGKLTELKYFNFFMYGSWSLLNPFLPLYLQDIGFSNVQIGLLMSVGPIISLLANPFWGYWSDRLQNTRLIIIVMLIGNILTSQIFFQTNHFSFVFLFMLLFYFFQTALNPISNSLILQAIENTEYHFGTFRLWGSLGFAVMVLISSPFIQWIGVGKLGWLYGAFVVLTLLLSLRLPRQGKRVKKSKLTLNEMSHLWKGGLFVLFLILSVLISIPNRMNSTFISVFINSLGGSEVYVGWSWFFAAIVEVPIFMLLDRYLKQTSRAMFGLMVLVCGLYAVRWGLMMEATAPWQIIAIQLLHSVTFGISFYTGTQICDFLVPAGIRTTGQAVYGLAWVGLAGILAGPLGGWLYDEMGAQIMYLSSLIMSVIGMAGFYFIWQHYRVRESRETLQTENG